MVKKSIIAILILVALLALLAFTLLPSLIHKDIIKAEITDSFKQLTGLDLDIQGDINVFSFPTPHVVINFLDVHSAPEAAAPFLLEIKMMEVWPSLSSLFHNRLMIDKIIMSGVNVELERMKNDEMNWKTSAQATPATHAAPLSSESPFYSTQFTVTNAILHYMDTAANTAHELDDIQLFMNAVADKERSFKLTLRYKNRPVSVSGRIGELSQIASAGVGPGNLDIRSGKSSLTYVGDIGFKNNHPYIKGKARLETDDIVPLVELFVKSPAKKPADVFRKFLPFKADSEITTENGKIIFPHVVMESALTKGDVQATVTLPNRLDIKASIGTFDLEALIASGLLDIASNDEPAKDDSATFANNKSPFGLLEFSADLALADILYNNQHIKDAHFSFDTSNGEVNIPLASAVFPGDSRITFTGIGKQGYQGFALEGAIDAMGNDFAKMLETFKSKGLALPAEDFKRFRIKANTVVSAKDMRLSEIAARIENIGFVGGAIATFGNRPTLVAALRIGGVNLDHFIALWGLEDWRASFLEDSYTSKKEGFLSQSLKHLGYDIALNTSLEAYVLNGKMRDKTDFKLEATTGNLAFKNVRTSYNGSQLSGNIGLNVSGVLPRLDIDITADSIDTATFLNSGTISATEPLPKGSKRWTHDQFDFHWLTLLDAIYHLKVNHFKHGVFQADAMDIKGNINDHVLNVDTFTATVFGAPTKGRLSIAGGKIPTFNLAADIMGINVDQLFYFFPVLEGITGKYNVALRLDTNGTDSFSWISNLEGNVGIGGRDITIRGFNIQGIISAVNYVRTVADILDVVKRAWPGGSTIFSTIQGEWVIASGVLKPANMTLTNNYSKGLVEGAIDLVNWKVKSSITFLLQTLDAAHPPKMIVSYSGDLDAPERMLDTRSLEQYVTNKTSEKMLNQYGTH